MDFPTTAGITRLFCFLRLPVGVKVPRRNAFAEPLQLPALRAVVVGGAPLAAALLSPASFSTDPKPPFRGRKLWVGFCSKSQVWRAYRPAKMTICGNGVSWPAHSVLFLLAGTFPTSPHKIAHRGEQRATAAEPTVARCSLLCEIPILGQFFLCVDLPGDRGSAPNASGV